MNKLYDVAVTLADAFIPLCCALPPRGRTHKVSRFARFQRGMIERVEHEMKEYDGSLPVLWLHAPSFGEYAVARPIIRQIQSIKRHRVVLTLSSPTDYEALRGNCEGIDCLFLLPIDTKAHAHRLISAIKPSKAISISSGFFPNYLNVLHEEDVPTYLVAAHIGSKFLSQKWWGDMFRHAYHTYTHIFVLDETSRDRLSRLGLNRVTISENPLFDNVHAIDKTTTYGEQLIARFAHDRQVFVASNISEDDELRLVAGLANQHRDTRFIFVPHEITSEGLRRIKYELAGRTLLYSECNDETDFTDVQVLVIDFLGASTYIYRYASWVYIGGKFMPLSRDVFEAANYGVPMAFGSVMCRNSIPLQLIKLGIGCKVRNQKELDAWFVNLKGNNIRFDEIRRKAKAFIANNQYAARNIAEGIMGDASILSSHCVR